MARRDVNVGYGLLAALGNDDVKALLAQHLEGRAGRQPAISWWHVVDTVAGAVYEVFAESRWADNEHQRLHTILALASEWRSMTGEDPPEYDDERDADTATRV